MIRRTLEHFQAKHSLGLDPRVDTGSPQDKCDDVKRKRANPNSIKLGFALADMADQEKRTPLERLDGRGNMRLVLRLAGWGLAAAAALAIVILASRSENGQRHAAGASDPAQSEAIRVATAPILARADAAERMVRRLEETVKTLSADRDKLLGRVAALERGLEDLTGSIALTQPSRRPAMDLLMMPDRSDALPQPPPPTPATGSAAGRASPGPSPAVDTPPSLAPDQGKERK